MMKTRADDLRHVMQHRPMVQLPGNQWQWYQEWLETLFFHWQFPAEVIQPLLPPGVQLDVFEGKAWISLVPFTMRQVRPRNLPPLAFVSNFHEVNLRTYVTNGKDHGVYFFSIEAEKYISAFVSRRFSGMPYEKALIVREEQLYSLNNLRTGSHLKVHYRPGAALTQKTELERWLTERYFAYVPKNGRIFKFQLHHPEWALHEPGIQNLSISYKLGNLHLSADTVQLMHYSPGVQVIAWPAEMEPA